MSFITWKKGDRFPLSSHFMSTEFECKCRNASCVEQKVSSTLVDKLENVRIKLQAPITITNSFRCSAYNKELKDLGYKVANNSQHLLGRAADITSRKFDELFYLLEDEFKAIGLARTFYHVDERDDKDRRWFY
jgi:hypothetical protein